jgi:hypothetical protein
MEAKSKHIGRAIACPVVRGQRRALCEYELRGSGDGGGRWCMLGQRPEKPGHIGSIRAPCFAQHCTLHWFDCFVHSRRAGEIQTLV